MVKKRKKSNTADAPMAIGTGTHEPRWDLETLSRAQEIIKDTRRFSAAQKEAKKQSESMARISRLKDVKI